MKKTLSTLALSLFALVGVTQAADITVENAAGKQVVPQNPQRVIVLDFGAADTLRALGVQDKIVGFPQSGKIPNYLSEFADKKYKNVGDLKEQSLEQINELNPDLIIASKRQEKMIDKFKEIAPVFNVENDYNNYYPSFQQNVTALGQIFGKENVAKEKLSALESKIDQVAKMRKTKPPYWYLSMKVKSVPLVMVLVMVWCIKNLVLNRLMTASNRLRMDKALVLNIS